MAESSSVTSPVTLREALHAFTAINQDLVLFDYANVVIQRKYQNSTTVRLFGGGLAGTDLCHATLVGQGMLTAAILGENAVPSSREILHTIKELNQNEENCGTFVIAQANADLFNFGLAVERANADCRMRVKLLQVYDDAKIKGRYSCGLILIIKILGALAEQGAVFDEIEKCYKEVIDNIVTVSLHYSQEETKHLKQTIIAIDEAFDEQVRDVIDKKSTMNLGLHPSVPIVALINIPKSLERLFELRLVKTVIEKMRQMGVSLARLYYGNYVTTSAKVASLTIMKVYDKNIIQYLDAQCNATGWHQLTQFYPEITLKNEISGLLQHHGKKKIPLKGPNLAEDQTKILLKSLQFACDALISCERQLNTIDAEKSNGNVGTRLKYFAEHLNKKLAAKKIHINCPYAFLKKLSVIAESAIGGPMGSIYGIFFESASNLFGELPDGERVTPFLWARAFSAGTNAINPYCAENMMFYPIECCELLINRAIGRNEPYLQCFGYGVSGAEEAAQRTKSSDTKHPDAGAHAVGIWLRAIFEGVKLFSTGDNCEKGC